MFAAIKNWLYPPSPTSYPPSPTSYPPSPTKANNSKNMNEPTCEAMFREYHDQQNKISEPPEKPVKTRTISSDPPEKPPKPFTDEVMSIEKENQQFAEPKETKRDKKTTCQSMKHTKKSLQSKKRGNQLKVNTKRPFLFRSSLDSPLGSPLGSPLSLPLSLLLYFFPTQF